MTAPIPGATIDYPFPWTFIRENYSAHFLASCASEEHVQKSILKLLRAYQVDAIAIDAGGKRERGRAIRRAKMIGIDVAAIVKGGNGSTIPPGHADIAATLAPDGVSLYIEVKAPAWITPGGKIAREAGIPSVEQLDFLSEKFARGAFVMVAYSIDDVANHLGKRLQNNLDTLRGRRS